LRAQTLNLARAILTDSSHLEKQSHY
jgi:hypothetical protein